MITEQKKEELTNEFDNLVRSISISNADVEGLLKTLHNKSFYDAPASTQYNCSYAGGLVEHCLNVYHTLDNLVKTYCPNMYDDNSIKIVGLLHCVYKYDFYETYNKNEKVYSDKGSKYDNGGRYDWVSTKAYKVKDASDRFVCSSNSNNSYVMLSSFIPLNKDEASAIMNQDCNVNNGQTMLELPTILKSCPLTNLLHCAIMISTYTLEQ